MCPIMIIYDFIFFVGLKRLQNNELVNLMMREKYDSFNQRKIYFFYMHLLILIGNLFNI